MNSLRVTGVNPDPQLNTCTQDTADLMRPEIGSVITLDKLNMGINYVGFGHFAFGQTLGIDVQGRSLEDGETPQPGIIDFARNLGIKQEQLVMPLLDKHTTDVHIVDGWEQLRYEPSQGRTVGYDAQNDNTYIDALIIKDSPETSEMVLAITGADCPAIVGTARLLGGQRVMFGLHAGRKGCLGGIVENTALALIEQGVIPGSVRIAIGPGGQTLELPLAIVQKEASANSHALTEGIWKQSSVARFNSLETREPRVIYDNQADVIRRARLVFGELLAPNGFTVVDANTITSDGLSSYRGYTIADKLGDSETANEKLGRNALFTRFHW